MNPAFALKTKNKTRPCIVMCLLGLALLAGCDRGEVTSYEIPKETPPTSAPSAPPTADPHAGMAMSRPTVTWEVVPEGWSQAAGGSGLRLATFNFSGGEGQSGEMAIIPMGGFAGTDVQLVNMWRMQLGLPELAEAEAEGKGTPITVGGVEGRLYEMTGTAQETPTRLLIASVNKDGMNYFFKLIGNDSLVLGQKPAFQAFLDGVNFEAGSATAVAAPGAVPSANADAARWEAPTGWTELAATQFLLAKYEVPGEGGQTAQVTVSRLGGDAGGLLPNVNRWRGQLNLPPVDEGGLAPLVSDIKAGNVDAVLVTLEGTDSGGSSPSRMLTAVVSVPGETWFFKITGPVALIDAKAGEFIAFVNATRF